MQRKGNLLDRIREHLPRLTPTHATIASAVLEYPDEVAFLTAAALAQRVGVSESTVVRFAMALGYSGYNEMQAEAEEMVRHKLSTVNRLMKSGVAQVSGERIYHKVMRTDIANIQRTLDELPETLLETIADAILVARNVYVVGFRTAHSLASFLGFALDLTRPGIHVVKPEFPLEQLESVNSDDLTIGITFKRYTRQTVEVFQLAHQLGSRTVAITDSPLSPLVAFADWTLYARNDLPSIVDSFVAPLSLINALVTLVGLKGGKAALERLQHFERIWEQYNVFHPESMDLSRQPSLHLDEA